MPRQGWWPCHIGSEVEGFLIEAKFFSLWLTTPRVSLNRVQELLSLILSRYRHTGRGQGTDGVLCLFYGPCDPCRPSAGAAASLVEMTAALMMFVVCSLSLSLSLPTAVLVRATNKGKPT